MIKQIKYQLSLLVSFRKDVLEQKVRKVVEEIGLTRRVAYKVPFVDAADMCCDFQLRFCKSLPSTFQRLITNIVHQKCSTKVQNQTFAQFTLSS